MMWTRRTTPQVISSRRLVETFDRLTSSSSADLLGVERLGRDEQQGVDLGHRPVDAPGLAHLAPVEHELLGSGSEFHGRISAMTGQTVSTEIILLSRD